MKLLIDADFIVYKCCAATETEIDFGDDVIVVASSFKEAYKGLGDANVMNIKQYFTDSEFDANKFALDWGIAVVEDYMENEGFDYVFFINDNTFKYHLFKRDELIEKLTLDKGRESYIYIDPKDGLPRWSAISTLTD